MGRRFKCPTKSRIVPPTKDFEPIELRAYPTLFRPSIGPQLINYYLQDHVQEVISEEMNSFWVKKHLGQHYKEWFDYECCQNSGIGYK